MEAGLVKVPTGDIVNKANSIGGMGKDLKDLQGIWTTANQGGSNQSFEFKQRKMIVVYRYSSQNGGSSEQTTYYTVKQDEDKIIMTNDTRENSEYSQWYEIVIPFSIDKLEISNHSKRPDGSSKNILFLKRDL